MHERFGVELEHEVQFLGPLELPPAVGEATRARRSETPWPPAKRPTAAHAPVLPVRGGAAGPRGIAALGPLARSSGSRSLCSPSAPTSARARRRSSPCRRSTCAAATPSSARRCAHALARRGGDEPADGRRRRASPRGVDADSRRARVHLRPRVPAHAARHRAARAAGARPAAPGSDAYLVAASGRVIRTLPHPRLRTCRGSG